eukprot:jgi/Galph1/716/GphlegSOOS_G5564.1
MAAFVQLVLSSSKHLCYTRHVSLLNTNAYFPLGSNRSIIRLSLYRRNRVILTPVREGEAAPDFVLKDQFGNQVRLSDFKGKKAVVLYFYPKVFCFTATETEQTLRQVDDTPGCTKQALAFKESIENFKQLGAEVIGISSDEDHKKFVDKYGLTFTLLSDAGSKVRRMFQVPSTLGILPGRVTYVIDKQGIVRKIYNDQFRSELHVEEARRALEFLNQ